MGNFLQNPRLLIGPIASSIFNNNIRVPILYTIFNKNIFYLFISNRILFFIDIIKIMFDIIDFYQTLKVKLKNIFSNINF